LLLLCRAAQAQHFHETGLGVSANAQSGYGSPSRVGSAFEGSILYKCLDLFPSQEQKLTRMSGVATRAYKYIVAVSWTELAITTMSLLLRYFVLKKLLFLDF
jgi:hypothetical protein